MEILRTDGAIEVRKGKISLEEVKKIIGGYVEVVNIFHGFMLVNEDARMQRVRPPINAQASRIACTEILGDAIYIESLTELE